MRLLLLLSHLLLALGFFLPAQLASGVEFSLGLRGGLPVNPVVAYGIESYLHFGDFAVGISHVSGKSDIKDNIDDGSAETVVEKARATARLSLLEARYFLFWGLNGTVGIGQRQMGLEFDLHEADNVSRLTGVMTADSWVVSHTVGVEWHFGWWYFAADGIGYAYPLQTRGKSDVQAEGNLTGDLGQVDQDLADAADDMGHVITKQLFLVSIGLVL